LATGKTGSEGRLYSFATFTFRKTIPACFVIGGDWFSADRATHFETSVLFLNQFFKVG